MRREIRDEIHLKWFILFCSVLRRMILASRNGLGSKKRYPESHDTRSRDHSPVVEATVGGGGRGYKS